MEIQINKLETQIEKRQEIFDKEREEIKKNIKSVMNSAILEIKTL